MTPTRPPHAYDLFLSHSHADREWVHALADRVAAEDYHGRPLRPWLDEQILDPGQLGSEAELTTALDRSRLFAIVLSPRSAASHYVGLEIEHFLSARSPAEVVPLLLRDCDLPEALRGFGDPDGPGIIDFRDPDRFEAGFAQLLDRVSPIGGESPDDAAGDVDRAVATFEANDPGGFWAEPRPERDALYEVLARHDIDDAAAEGLALAAFDRAAHHLLRLSRAGSDQAYNFKMLLAECLVASLLRTNGYRQVAQRYLDAEGAAAEEGSDDPPVLLFVVARAYAKLADQDPSLVDLGVLLRMASRLDGTAALSNEERAIETLLARAAGKLRSTAVGELLLKILSRRGRSSRVAAAGGIALSSEREGPVYYLSVLEAGDAERAPVEPPTRRLLGLLKDLEMDEEDPYARQRIQLARGDLERELPGIDLPYGFFWHPRRSPVPALNASRAPFMGILSRASLADMGARAEAVAVSTVTCLTELRVVDALFWNSGAILIPEQDPDAHQCRRLRARGVPFAMLAAPEIEALEDGDLVVVDEESFTVWAPTR